MNGGGGINLAIGVVLILALIGVGAVLFAGLVGLNDWGVVQWLLR